MQPKVVHREPNQIQLCPLASKQYRYPKPCRQHKDFSSGPLSKECCGQRLLSFSFQLRTGVSSMPGPLGSILKPKYLIRTLTSAARHYNHANVLKFCSVRELERLMLSFRVHERHRASFLSHQFSFFQVIAAITNPLLCRAPNKKFNVYVGPIAHQRPLLGNHSSGFFAPFNQIPFKRFVA